MKKGKMMMVVVIFMFMAMFVPGMTMAGSLEPSAPPGPTMRTLDQVRAWIKVDPATRFVDNGDGTVLDRETGLTWTKNASIIGTHTWDNALYYAYASLTVGNRMGWRLPTVDELASLIDSSQSNPALPIGHPFINVQFYYWSSTSYASNPAYAFGVGMYSGGYVTYNYKSSAYYVWPVRGGN